MVKINGKLYKSGAEMPQAAQMIDEPDERKQYQTELDKRGIKYHWNASAEKLKAMIEEDDRENGVR